MSPCARRSGTSSWSNLLAQCDRPKQRGRVGRRRLADGPVGLDRFREPDRAGGEVHDRGRSDVVAHAEHRLLHLRVAGRVRAGRAGAAGRATPPTRRPDRHHPDPARRHAQRHRRIQARGRGPPGRHPGDQRWHRPERCHGRGVQHHGGEPRRLPGYLTAYPCSSGVPDTSTVNYVGGQTVANTTIAALSSAGQLCVWSYAETDILVDITGWLGAGRHLAPDADRPDAGRRHPHRASVGIRLGPGATLTVDLNGRGSCRHDGGRPERHRRRRLGAGVPDGVPVRTAARHVDRQLRRRRGPSEQHDRRAERGQVLHLQLRGDRRAHRPRRIVRLDRVLLQADRADPRDRHPPVPAAPGSAGEAIAYSVSTAALGGTPARCCIRQRHGCEPHGARVTSRPTTVACDANTSTLNQQVGQATANGAIVPLVGLQSCAWTYGGGDLIVDLNGWWVP